MTIPTDKKSNLIVARQDLINLAKARFRDGDPMLRQAVDSLKAAADAALATKPITIAGKSRLPPSGVRQDYLSMGPYWWPDPASPDGLPYIRRDGLVNPEAAQYDRLKLTAMTQAVETLALAWHYLENPVYAGHAANLLHGFFLDPQTRMNPHLEYGQFIPGRCSGRGIGIIETRVLAAPLLDAVNLLATAPGLPTSLRPGLEAWFANYLDWLLRSAHGRDERNTRNNHATAYDLQVAVFALFTGETGLARKVLQAVPARRIQSQIEPDGSQPHELTRTKALGYASCNLRLFFCLARTAAGLDFDLWNYETADGRGIRRALDWLLPYWTRQRPWPYQQIAPFSHERAYRLLRQAAWAYDNEEYEQALNRLPKNGDPSIPVARDTIDGEGGGQMPLGNNRSTLQRYNLYEPPRRGGNRRVESRQT